MEKKPAILSQRIVTSSRLFKVEELQLRFSNGEERIYERLAGGMRAGAVMVVAMLDKEHFIMIEEYCAGVDDYQLTIPKGLIEKDEDVLAAANRELKEEAGYGAKKLEYVTSLTLSPSYMAQRIQVVLAQDLYPEKLEGDEPEPIIVSTAKLNDLLALSQKPNFTEGRAIAALYIVRDLLISRGELTVC
ncbi:ADP compounds hydrolase NudE [Entomomonas asaccharolytica]|uniref:ADP compounds hydrolase NudE n=1 Tax=Entomomonas asaccharolytica TaxID=2785331 RepID=A0A974RWP7_9GAMM|nr:ADP compounds hydrolase NudE [Entomomonas asaccharolytica]QQP85431.1 ADP compounds hydrolase NudE [Entomomonas asaccharolytica]